jgi:hypothetical protein
MTDNLPVPYESPGPVAGTRTGRVPPGWTDVGPSKGSFHFQLSANPTRTRRPPDFATTRASWIILGLVEMPSGGVRIIASKDIRAATLEAHVDYTKVDIDAFIVSSTKPTGYRIDLQLSMHNLTVIDAPTFPEAFAALFKLWTPDSGTDAYDDTKRALGS